MTKKDQERGGVDPREHSRVVVDGLTQAPSRAMLRAVGFKDEDFAKPQVGIASTWSMVTPCNMHIDGLARQAGEGADSAGGKSVLFNTITVSDGIANGFAGTGPGAHNGDGQAVQPRIRPFAPSSAR